MASSRPTLLSFDQFELYPEERRLMARGRPVALAGKPLDLLILLAERAPALVTRGEIRSQLWPGRIIDFDSGVNACVRDIRKALEDDSRRQRLIQTVPRHGYRLVTAPGRGEARRRRWTLAAAGGALMLLAAATWHLVSPEQVPAEVPAREARDAFVQGDHLLAQHDPADARRAVPHFRRAIESEPLYAAAWAGLADALYFSLDPPSTSIPEAMRAAERALALDPELARPHRRLADIRYFWSWDIDAAETSYRRALALDRGDAMTYHAYAAFLVATNRSNEAFALMNRALAIDPLSLVMHGDLAWFHAMNGEHEQALDECSTLLELAPASRRAIGCPLRSLLALGRLEEAAIIAGRLAGGDALGQGSASKRLAAFWALQLDRLRTSLAASRFVDPVSVALVHARLNDPVAALDWIEKAREQRSRLYPFLRLYPEFRALHGNDRFARLAPAIRPTT